MKTLVDFLGWQKIAELEKTLKKWHRNSEYVRSRLTNGLTGGTFVIEFLPTSAVRVATSSLQRRIARCPKDLKNQSLMAMHGPSPRTPRTASGVPRFREKAAALRSMNVGFARECIC